MASASTEDCVWVVKECKARLRAQNKFGAKAWIITARSLYPQNFDVQWDMFMLHINCRELQDASETLAELCTKFTDHPKLDAYILDMTSCVCGLVEDIGSEEKIKMDIFQNFSPEVQKMVLQQCAAKFKDSYKKSKAMVEIIKRFPHTAPKIGLDALETLCKSFYESPPSPMECTPLHKLLVVDVIPLVTGSRDVLAEGFAARPEPHQVLLKMGYFCQWLEITGNYYTAAIAGSALQGDRTPVLFDGRTGWDAINELMYTIAGKCGWREISRSKVIGPKSTPKQRWGFLEKLPRGSDIAIGPFYVAVLLYFQMAWEYYSTIKGLYYSKQQLGEGAPEGGDVSDNTCWVLVEDCSTGTQFTTTTPTEGVAVGESGSGQTQGPSLSQSKDEPVAKKRKVDNEVILDFHTGNIQVDQYAIECFKIALNCKNFLNSDITYRDEFNRLSKVWGTEEWLWLKSFEIDMALYNREYFTIIERLQKWKEDYGKDTNSNDLPDVEKKNKYDEWLVQVMIQLLSCCLVTKDLAKAANLIKELVAIFPEDLMSLLGTSGGRKASISGAKSKHAHHLILLPCQPVHIIRFIGRYAVRALKDFHTQNPQNDTAVGQLIILLQLDLLKEETYIRRLFQAKIKEGSFIYPPLLKYITQVQILEEIAGLVHSESVDKVIVIPEVESETQRRKTVTRGVNKEKHDELMITIQRQIKKWKEPVEVAISNFLQTEMLCFIPDN